MKYITESAANDMMNIIGYTMAAATQFDIAHMTMDELEELRKRIFRVYCEHEGITHVEMENDASIEDKDEDEDEDEEDEDEDEEDDEPRRPFMVFDTETSPMIYDAFFTIKHN